MCNKYKEKSIKFWLHLVKMSKKGDFGYSKVINCNFSTKSVPTQYDFCNSTIPWGRKIRTIWGPPVKGKINQFWVKLWEKEQKKWTLEIQK